MFFKQIPVGKMKNFSYLITDANQAALVDPGFDAEKLVKIAKEEHCSITKILLTHTHYDHIDALSNLLGEWNAEVYVHEKEAQALATITSVIQEIKDGDIISLGKREIEVLHTPGHTPGSITYRFGKRLLTGDTLFIECCGRTDLKGGDRKALYASLQRLKQLPDDFLIYPGHDYGDVKYASLGHEKKHNPFLRMSREQFMKMR